MYVLRCLVWSVAVVCVLAFTLSAQSCPFCDGEKGPTLVGQFDEAQIVVYGHFKNARITNNGLDQGETDFEIERVLKSHDLVKGQAKLTLPRYVPNTKSKFIIFCRCVQA